jgi:uncharacterized integral membrane protein
MVRKLCFGILLVLVVIFVAQNTQIVEVKFLIWKASMSRALMLLGTFLLGIFVTLLLKIPRRKK